jgi:N-acetylneuraminate synthase/sialic acid synthase
MKRQLTIDGFCINDESDCFVVAEIGHNHQGDLDTSKKMIQIANDLGANAVKLQKRDNRKLFTKALYNSPYLSENSYGDTYGEHREALEFGRSEYEDLKKFTAELGIKFFATAFDFASADFLADMDMPAFKIASGDLTNTPLLKHIAKIGKPMLVSTGGGTLDDVKRAYHTIMPINQQLCIMQCTAAYPVTPEDMHLRVITTYREMFPDIVVGLSDHESGIGMSLVGYMLGARVIEKHFTLNRAWRGTDHAFSLGPGGFRRLVRDLRRAQMALGDPVKKRLAIEEKPLYKMAKKLVTARNLPKGHILKREDIAIKSPNDGLPPYELDNVIGRKTMHALNEDENITLECLTENEK